MEQDLFKLAKEILPELVHLREQAIKACDDYRWEFSAVAPECLSSARNLVHTLYLRSSKHHLVMAEKLKGLCIDIGAHETHQLYALEECIYVVACVAHHGNALPSDSTASSDAKSPLAHFAPTTPLCKKEGRRILLERCAALYGDRQSSRRYTSIMVTVDPGWCNVARMRRLLRAGCDVVRLNTAHDNCELWTAVEKMLREAEKSEGREEGSTRLHIDFSGPKLRTLPISGAGAKVVKVRPGKDIRGRVVKPQVVTFFLAGKKNQVSSDDAGSMIALEGDEAEILLREAKPGFVVSLVDARGKARDLPVFNVQGSMWMQCSVRKTTFFETFETVIVLTRGSDGATIAKARVGNLPLVGASVGLAVGAELTFVAPSIASRASQGAGGSVAQRLVPVDMCGAVVKEGHRVMLDDGQVRCRVTRVTPEGNVECKVEICPRDFQLKPEKGINLPDSDFPPDTEALTSEDRCNLRLMLDSGLLGMHRPVTLGLSFVRTASDVHSFHRIVDSLVRPSCPNVSTCIKIETSQAVSHLPAILMACLWGHPTCIMLARGDLAGELGFDRLAAATDDLTVLCAAAHLPVVYATQILDTMNRTGTPARSEVADVVMGSRCEALMLNKGSYLEETVQFLDEMLCSIQQRQHKHRLMLRKLSTVDLIGYNMTHDASSPDTKGKNKKKKDKKKK